MRALAVVPARRKVTLIDAPAPPPPSEGEARVRTLEVGICGTDKEIASFHYGTPPTGSDHLILGHECLGEVVEVGPGATRVRVGDLVVPRVRRPCPFAVCLPCREGRSDYCITDAYTERGIRGAHGFACETWVDRIEYLHVVPRALRAVGVLAEPLSIAEKALATVELVQTRLPTCARGQGARCALVIGSGPVGLLGALALVRAGFDTHVYARSRAPNVKADAAIALGAAYLSSQEVPADQLRERIDLPDLVYEAAGASRTAFDVLKVLGPNGAFVFTGVPGRKEPLELDGAALMKQLVLSNQVTVGTVNAGPDAFEAAVRELVAAEERSPSALAQLITHRHTPDEAADVLSHAIETGIKHVIRFA